MKKKKIMFIALAALLVVFFILKKKVELMRAPVFGTRPALVSVFYARKRPIEKFSAYLAKVEPEEAAKVSPKITAVVDEIYVDEGSVVKKGCLLARLDKRDILAKLNSAKSSLSAAEQNFTYWEKEYERDKTLFREGAVSEEAMDKAKDNFAQAKARKETARENVSFWQVQLSYAEIVSPYDGVVSKRMVDTGDLAVVGKPLFLVENRARLKLVFDAPQEDLRFIKKGQEVYYGEEGYSKRTKIANIFPSIGPGKMVRVEAYVLPEPKLHVGEFIPIKVLVAREEDAVVVPNSAICKSEGHKPFVFIVEKGALKKQTVVLGIKSEMFVEVKNLGAGAAVVKNPFLSWTKLSDGQSVKIIGKSEK